MATRRLTEDGWQELDDASFLVSEVDAASASAWAHALDTVAVFDSVFNSFAAWKLAAPGMAAKSQTPLSYAFRSMTLQMRKLSFSALLQNPSPTSSARRSAHCCMRLMTHLMRNIIRWLYPGHFSLWAPRTIRPHARTHRWLLARHARHASSSLWQAATRRAVTTLLLSMQVLHVIPSLNPKLGHKPSFTTFSML